MAGDWIKMRTDLYRDPKVCVIADFLMDGDSELARYINQQKQCDMAVTRNVMRNVTVGALVAVWGVLRHRGKRIADDLVVRSCRLSVVDDIADVPGFGDAMNIVGWVKETKEGIVLPNFFSDFNVDPSEELKEKNAERQRKYRAKHNVTGDVTVTPSRNVTVTSHSNAREEKRRDITPIVPKGTKDFLNGAPAGFVEFWKQWPSGPRKAAATKCLGVWREKKYEQDAPVILAHVAAMKTSRQWRDGYDPAPLVYLRNAMWTGAEPQAEERETRFPI